MLELRSVLRQKMAPPRLTPEQLLASKMRRRQKETERRRLLRQDPAFRARERERNAAARREARQDENYRQREREREALARRRARQDPEYRRKEQERNTEAKRRARRDPMYRELQRAKEAAAREFKKYLMEEQTKTMEAHQEAAWFSSFALRYMQNAWTSSQESELKGAEKSFLSALEDGSMEPECSLSTTEDDGFDDATMEEDTMSKKDAETSAASTSDEGSKGAEASQTTEEKKGAGNSSAQTKTDPIKEAKCPQCSFTSPWPSITKAHERLHSQNMIPIKCGKCLCTFVQQDSFIAHMCTYHTDTQQDVEDAPYLRVVCPTLSGEKESQVLYLPVTENPFPGNTALSVKKTALERRTQQQTEDRPFRCDLCSAAFVKAVGLKCHMRVHSTDRPFACDICPIAFKHATSLAKHRQTHTPDGEFKCSICFCAFGRQSNLTRHMRQHSEGMAPRSTGLDSTADGRNSPELISPDGPPLCIDNAEVDSIEVVQCIPELLCTGLHPSTGSPEEEALRTDQSMLGISCLDKVGSLNIEPLHPTLSPAVLPAHSADAVYTETVSTEIITPEVISPKTVLSTTVDPIPLNMVKAERSTPEAISVDGIPDPPIDSSMQEGTSDEVLDKVLCIKIEPEPSLPSADQNALEVAISGTSRSLAVNMEHVEYGEMDLITPEVISPNTFVHPVPLDVVKIEESASKTASSNKPLALTVGSLPACSVISNEVPSDTVGPARPISVPADQSRLQKWKRTLQMKCLHDV